MAASDAEFDNELLFAEINVKCDNSINVTEQGDKFSRVQRENTGDFPPGLFLNFK
jgi:hypothetical protein